MRNIPLLVTVLLLVAGCGGSGGRDGSGGPAPERFPAADVRGISALIDPGAGAPPAAAGAAEFASAAEDARTEIARAIEEADLYRVAGDLLYLLSAHRGLTIIDLSQPALSGQLPLPGVPLEMYLREDRALVLVAEPQGGTQLVEISVADATQPAVTRSESMAGPYRTSRLVGDVLYAVMDRELRSFLTDVTPFAPAGELTLPGSAAFAHATDSHLFVAGGNAANGTTVTLVDVSDTTGSITLRGAIDLPGYVADDQKLDFGGGVLRVVTHDWTDAGLSRLFTVNVADPDAPAVLATLELARGEQLFATRFTADRAYLVTFERIDPLWVIDLSDPRRPYVAGELLTPGFATQMAVDGSQLVTIGVDPDRGWRSEVSLFDVSDPAHPALLDREDVGDSSTTALWDRKAFGVFPGRVLVPRWNGLAVVDRAADSLTLRGVVEVRGGALRGFPQGDALVAAGNEEVVLADAVSLEPTGRVVIAENVVDVGRLADGRLLQLVQAGDRARLGGAEVTLWAEALYPFGRSAAVVGWDALGRAAYVVDFAGSEPVVSARLDLGAGGGLAAPDLAAGGAALIAPVFAGAQAALTSSGKLVLHGLPGGNPYDFGEGAPVDGLVVIDIPRAALGRGVLVRDAAIDGFVADGAVLAFTFATSAGQDGAGRPLLEHRYVRIELDAGTAARPVGVPGYVVAAAGPELFTVLDEWADEWSATSTVVAARIDGERTELRDRLQLPAGAYDPRAAGGTLFFTVGGGSVVPLPAGLDRPTEWLPGSQLGTVRLGAALARGPDITGTDAFRALLLPEDGAALVTRDALTLERWDVGGSTAELAWTAALPAYPLRAHADAADPGRYLVALGYAGHLALP